MDKIKISVIVPCYNMEKYIDKTVQSILEQTYKRLEIILIDDGSTDGTLQRINQLSCKHTNIYAFHKENGGVSSARLYGIKCSTGEWIAFVDGDDLLKPEMYTNLIRKAVQYNADISHCGYEMIFPNHVDKYYGTKKIIQQSNIDGVRDLLAGNFVEPSLCNKIFKRNIVIEALNECSAVQNIRNMEDLLWNYYFFKRAAKSVFIDECYYQYVLRKGSAATSEFNKHKVLDPLRVFRMIEKDVYCIDDLRRIVERRKIAKLIELSIMDTDDKPDWAKRCSLKARNILRNKRHYSNIQGNMRFKIKVMLASFSPATYLLIYRIYSKIRGNAHLYDI